MRITCVHQGFELYGSDRSFVETVGVLRAAYPGAEIEVVLPRSGSIVSALAPYASRVTVEPLWILRRRDLKRLATLGLATLPVAVARAVRRIRASDLTYVNTSVVADYLIASGLCPGRCVVHVHEIPEGVVRAGLRALVRWSRAQIVFNSKATQAAFALPGSGRARVVYNGIADPLPRSSATGRTVADRLAGPLSRAGEGQGEGPGLSGQDVSLIPTLSRTGEGAGRAERGSCASAAYDGTRPLRLLMLGRISRIKGQDVLVEALARLPAAIGERIETRIVGSAFEDAERERALACAVETAGLSAQVSLLPFAPDPSEHFLWADVVAVPSCLPESLGRVAIEAMAYGLPPIVSDIGGLPEIVLHGRTGWIVPPGDSAALSETLGTIVAEPRAWRWYGTAARLRYGTTFAEDASARGMLAAFEAVLARKSRSVPTVQVTEPARP